MLFCATAHAGDYQDGWQCGWKEGWRIESGDYFTPFPPFAPFPPLGHDCYRDGFSEGVLAGAQAARCGH
ncbi:MAG: hypothetical protein DME55_07775 [Verrucomicrobia bacterium]|nr:MAG: hypothetical protein DME55_07775 [Verrucomicrobiota bacterium]